MVRVVRRAHDRGCVLELNAHAERLDLTDIHRQMAREAGVLGRVASDPHSTLDFATPGYEIGQACGGWLEKRDVLNSRLLAGLQALL
jgi:DNA polymerase (family 10)